MLIQAVRQPVGGYIPDTCPSVPPASCCLSRRNAPGRTATPHPHLQQKHNFLMPHPGLAEHYWEGPIPAAITTKAGLPAQWEVSPRGQV